MPNSSLELRDLILDITHRWYQPLLAFLAGCLVGLAVIHLFPTDYQATADIAVRYSADNIYRNPDDYKNWQLEQLNALALASDVTEQALIALRQQDRIWTDISRRDFQETLDLSWRNTGLWRFAVIADSRPMAAQAAQAWSEAVLAQYSQAQAAASELSVIESRLAAANQALVDAQMKQAELSQVLNALNAWVHSAASASDQALGELERTRLLTLVSLAAGQDPAWQTLLQGAPAVSDSRAAYLAWTEQAIQAIQSKLEAIQGQVANLNADLPGLQADYQAAIAASRGLSAKLVLENASEFPLQAAAIRPTPTAVLVGGVLGLLVWALYWLVIIVRRK